MTGNQTKLDDFVSPSTEENSVVETVELVNGQVLTFNERTTIEDEDLDYLMGREDFDWETYKPPTREYDNCK